ncbi:MAG: PadR family transcriptional regulator [Streptosporangiales bacterium]
MALLEARPMTGYELAKQFDESARRVWHAQHPQIYTELRRLEQEGLVEGTAAPRGTKAIKRTYFLTEDGCAELARWVGAEQQPARERDATYLKATYFEFGSIENARRQFRAHLEHYRLLEQQWCAHADQLDRRDTSLLQLRLSRTPEAAHDALVAFKVHVYRGLVERARTEVEWARSGLRLLDRLQRDADVAPDEPLAPPVPNRP